MNMWGLLNGEYTVWLVVGFFFFKRNENGKQESRKALNLYLF